MWLFGSLIFSNLKFSSTKHPSGSTGLGFIFNAKSSVLGRDSSLVHRVLEIQTLAAPEGEPETLISMERCFPPAQKLGRSR